MVSRFLFGMLSGGVLVIGGLVIGSALFPPRPMEPTNDLTVAQDTVAPPAEVEAALPDATPIAVEETTQATTEPELQPVPEPEAVEATAPEAESEDAQISDQTAKPEAEPLPEAAAEEPAQPTTDATNEGKAVAEEPPAATTEPNAEANAPTADPAPAAAPEPQPESEPPAASETVEAPVAPDTGTNGTAGAPEVAEVASPEQPAAPVPLQELDTDSVLAALEKSVPAPPEEQEGGTVLAELAPPAEETPPVSEGAGAAEPVPEVAAEPTPEPAPEPEIAPEPEPAPSAEDVPVPENEGTPPARLPGTVAHDMPGTRSADLPEDVEDKKNGVIVDRLPRIGDAPALPSEAEVATVEAAPAELRPIDQYAAVFDNPDGKPVLAIVLIDPGTAGLDRAGLAALPFPVSFALDPMDPATPERAAIYRAAGKEVVMLATGIADGAQATDVEVSFQSMEQGLPEAVAVMDLQDGSFQSKRTLASIVVPVVGAQGRGLLTWDKGLNAADQVARREDIAAAVVFRDLASAGDDSAAIRRVLDRAVFKAGQDGRVTLAGTASPTVIAALLEWTVEGRAATVAIAPLTAALTVD